MTPGVLTVLGGADRGKTFPLNGQESRIGRGADQDIVLSDIAVSRRHIVIHREGLNYKLQDLGSGNGTLVNGQRVSVHYLKDGDVIECGQTVMRFDHAALAQPAAMGGLTGMGFASPSAVGMGGAPAPQPVPMTAPPPYVPPSQPRPMPPAPSASIDLAGATQVPPVYTPSDATMAPAPRPQAYAGAGAAPAEGGLSPTARLIAMAVMGVISVICVVVVLAKTVFAKPVVVQNDAEEQYKQGLKLFMMQSFEDAKVAFGEALTQAPDSPDVKRYLEACDDEIKNKQLFKQAEKAIAGKRYAEAMKALGEIDGSSLLADKVARLKRDWGPRAAKEEVAEAQKIAADEPDTAKGRLRNALKLDPRNEEARALLAKLESGAAVAVAPKGKEDVEPAPAPVEKPAPVAKGKPAPAPVEKPAKSSKLGGGKKDDDGDLAIVKVPSLGAAKEPPPVAPPPSAGNGMALYKAKDFENAARAFRMEAMKNPAQTDKLIAVAKKVTDLKAALDHAASVEASNPGQAMKDYETALGIDAAVGKGMHAAYIKQKMGKAQLASAQQAFAGGKYDIAFKTMQDAVKAGAGDGGLGKQLEAKAAELVNRAVAVQKSNPNQAKDLYRTVVRMVPPSSPSYVKAYGLLNNASAKKKDEDED
jgi:tetratricopeptide (TPR) repeat protein